MTALVSEPIEAVASDGIVSLFVDVETANEIAGAWELAHATGLLDDARRPTYLHDCNVIRQAAIDAALQTGHVPAAAQVPFLTIAPAVTA